MKNLLLGTTDFSIKRTCQKCKRATFCRDIDKKMRELKTKALPVWDKDLQDKLSYINAELELMGYSYPQGNGMCTLRKLNYRDLMDLIHYIQSMDSERTA